MRFIPVVVILLYSAISYGQYGNMGITDARSIALANTYATNSYGLQAVGKNPAQMANIPGDKHQIHLFFPNINILSLNFSEALNFIGNTFTGKKSDLITGLTDSKLKQVFDGNGRASIIGSLDFLSVGYQHSEKIGFFGFTVNEYISTYLRLPRVLIDFSSGKITEGAEATLNDFEFRTWWIRSHSLTYSRKISTGLHDGIEGIYVGAALKYYQGYVYTDILLNTTASIFDSDSYFSAEFDAQIRAAFSEDIRASLFENTSSKFRYPGLAPSGQGAGVDLGITMVFDKGISISASMTDIGRINWTEGAHYYEVSGVIDISRDITLEDIRNLGDSIIINTTSGDKFGTPTPQALHFGLGFQFHKLVRKFPGFLNIAWEFHQGMNTYPGNTDFIRTAVGLEYYYKEQLPRLLTGLSYGRDADLRWSLGLGYHLKFLHIYLSTIDMLAFFDPSLPESLSFSTYWIISFGKKNKKNKTN